VVASTIERFVWPSAHLGQISEKLKTKTEKHNNASNTTSSCRRISRIPEHRFCIPYSTLVITFALVPNEMGATAALTILSKLFLATLFARHVVLPSALQTLDWARSTLSLTVNKEFTAKIEKKCDQIVELALIRPTKRCARGCRERWLHALSWTQHSTQQQVASVRCSIEHQFVVFAGVSQHLRHSSKEHRMALEALAIRWLYRCIEVRILSSIAFAEVNNC
jgi:hypothetical protein